MTRGDQSYKYALHNIYMILYYTIFLYNYPKKSFYQIKVVFYGTETENNICSKFSAILDILLIK